MSTLPLSSTPSDPLRLSSQPAASPPSPPFFDPAPEIAAAILHDLADPFQSLHSIAKARATTLEGLTLWMQRPEIARRLDALESAFTRRSRLQAGSYLPLCIDAIARAIAGATRDEVQLAQSSAAQSQVSQSQSPQSQTSLKLDDHRRKARETLLRMTRVMMQLSKFQNAPPPKSEKASPARPSAVNAADARTPNSPTPSRVAANPAPQQVSHPDRRGEPATPRTGQSAQPHADSSSSREHQPTQRELSTV